MPQYGNRLGGLDWTHGVDGCPTLSLHLYFSRAASAFDMSGPLSAEVTCLSSNIIDYGWPEMKAALFR